MAGALAAVFGGSHLQVSGPTGAMTVVLVPIVARYGPSGVLTVGLLAGLMLIALAITRMGRLVRLVPAPVVEGFTAGIAAVIFLQQIPAALGAQAHGEKVLVVAWRAIAEAVVAPKWTSLALSGSVALIVLVGLRFRPAIPFSLLTVAAVTVMSTLLRLDVASIGELPATLPRPSLTFLQLDAVPGLLTAAVAVASLAALESLLSATVADGMRSGERHDPDREPFGQGIANVVTPLFGGVPATAAIARTAVNARAGATSRLAALSHALILALIMLAAAPLVAHIPLAALAGVLLATAIRMVHIRVLRELTQAGRSDALVLVITALATIALDLVLAVLLGLVVAGVLALRKVAQSMRVPQLPHDDPQPGVIVFRPEGPLFFAAAHRLQQSLSNVDNVQAVLIRLSGVTAMDATGAIALRDSIGTLNQRGIAVGLSGVRPEHHKTLGALNVLAILGERVYPDATTAVAALQKHQPVTAG